MNQMNISITDELATYVHNRVKSGRYNNASEVVREALRRMEEDDAKSLRLAIPSAEDILLDLDAEQLDGIRKRVKGGIASIDRGEFTKYDGREGLEQLVADVAARGRQSLAKRRAKK
jgi:antitoxin ParD1/3/4